MRIQSGVVLAVFVGLVVAIRCQESGQVYCGRRLATALGVLCAGGLGERAEGVAAAGRRGRLPWVSARLGVGARSVARAKRQVVAECCDKPCTTDELVSYCA